MPVPCAPLLELFDGQLGTVHLGQLTHGDDAGRFVLLRELGAPGTSLIAAEITRISGITHPKLLKLLSLGQAAANTYLVSEYVPGVALTELRSSLRKQHTSLPVPVAVRITLDALRTSIVARSLLRSLAGIETKAPFHPDSIWLAEFGEVLSTPIAGDVAPGRTPYSSSASDTPHGLLMELATGLSPAKLLGRGLAAQLPEQLARALGRALSAHARGYADSEAVLEDALAALPSGFLASDEQVAAELARVVGPRLQSRRLLLSVDQPSCELDERDETVIVRHEHTPTEDEPTRLYQRQEGRDADPDGATELLSTRPPSAGSELEPSMSAMPRIASQRASAWASAYLNAPSEGLNPTPIAAQSILPRTRAPLWMALAITAVALAAAAITVLQRLGLFSRR